MSGAEVVDGEPDAELLERVELPAGRLGGVLDHHLLADLEREPARVETAGVQSALDVVDDAGLLHPPC